ncbi:MAG: class I SAM-dependent methyltransferase [Actinomycetota bacterium]
MTEWEASTYGERIAGAYDDLYQGLFDVEATVDALAELAAGRPALELAIGTGRIALPLAARGVPVHGIDISEPMVARMRAKPGGSDIAVTMGDLAEVPVSGSFALIYLVFNTIFALVEQEDQLRCFRNVAAHLDPDGVFVTETFVPDPARFDRHQRVQANVVDVDRAMLDVSRHDPVNQRVFSQHLTITAQGIEMYPVQLRYMWPSEMDLMARLAGLRLRDRWGGWRGEPFTSESGAHVSVYERSEAPG